MLQIQGAIIVVPEAVRVEPTVLRVGGEENSPDPAVLLTALSASGQIGIVFPPEEIDEIIKGLKNAKEAAEKAPKTDLIVTDDMNSVKHFADELKQMNEVRK